jgi:hypothetical protein
VVIDTARHTARTVLSDRRMHGDISIAWSPDGMQLFASGGGAVMARYEVTTGHAQIVGADGVLHGFVAVSNDDARAFFAASGPRG